MNKQIKTLFAVSLLFAAGAFNSAKAITADELLVAVQAFASQVNQAFGQVSQLIFDLDSRVGELESASPNLGGYAMPFSADGAPKNVVVLAQPRDDGSIAYYLRTRYATSVEQISIDGVLVQRPFIAGYGFVEVDNLNNVVQVSNYIEAPDTADYIVWNNEATFYDPVSLAKTVTEDNLREDWSLCSNGERVICIAEVTENLTGDPVRTYSWSSFRDVNGSGAASFNGLTFPDVRMEEYAARGYTRLRARGIGEVMRTSRDSGDPFRTNRKAVFYRVEGNTGGSLAGTPFDAGQLLDGLFF